eukprot:TRINITY_DN1207_c0_g1_i4.p1 TRINITY_DN1207_c0_g1~~TRINITY_DN1207_c0_g1_i4.p1  ORF type:complete len:105 (+),score=3.53 TRINITY_DN1207_c0_g1_i4:195-509(+)
MPYRDSGIDENCWGIVAAYTFFETYLRVNSINFYSTSQSTEEIFNILVNNPIIPWLSFVTLLEFAIYAFAIQFAVQFLLRNRYCIVKYVLLYFSEKNIFNVHLI